MSLFFVPAATILQTGRSCQNAGVIQDDDPLSHFLVFGVIFFAA